MMEIKNSKLKNVGKLLIYLIPVAVFFTTSRFKILNPKYDGWLSEGDGTGEIAWEFYRNTDFPQWLIGNLDSYGGEMARPAFYTLPTFFTLPLRFFSFGFGDRFQIMGLILLLNFILHFYFSTKIFSFLDFSKINNIVSSSLLIITPTFHYRYLDHTHYLLNSHWIILAGFALVIMRSKSWLSWALLICASLLIFPYYIVFTCSIAFFYFSYQLLFSKISFIELLKIGIASLFAFLISAVLSGYVFFQNELESDNDNFKANLNTLINPMGWSRLLKDRPQNPGEYEGFAFIGSAFFILAIMAALLLVKNFQNLHLKDSKLTVSFILLMIPSLILALVSLSNEATWGETLIFSYPKLVIYELIEQNFRSIGRFIWILVYFIMILTLAVLNRFMTTKLFTAILIFSIFFGFWDVYPKLTSQIENRFSLDYKSPLQSKFWSEMSNCYDSVVSVPPVTTAQLLYPIAKVAYRQNMTIFPAYIARVPTLEQLARQRDMRKVLRLGNFQDNSVYVFQSARFVDDNITHQDKIIAINTMNKTSRAGTIDNIFVLAPNFENCDFLFTKYSQDLNIKKQDNFLVNQDINFANDPNVQNLLISGWSEIEQWGVWTNAIESEILFQVAGSKKIKTIEFVGHRYIDRSGQGPKMEVFVNEKRKTLFEKSSDKLESITIYLSEEERQDKNYLIRFRFSDLVSPLEDNGSADARELGYGLKNIFLK